MKARLAKPLVALAAGLSAASAALLLLYGVNEATGANIGSYSGTELGDRLWAADPDVGYRNRPSVEFLDFGRVPIRTNAAGFRSDREVPAVKEAGSTRVIGFGDSLMWGLHARAEESIMGRLERAAEAKGRKVEAFNAAVIGYSSLQELAFFRQRVLPARPDVAVLSFCNNDWAPTEDPFKNLVALTRRHLSELLRRGPGSFSSAERSAMRAALDDPRKLTQLRWAPDDFKRSLLKPLVALPLLEIAALAKTRRIRFVVLFIPYSPQSPMEDETVAALKSLFDSKGIEYLDLSGELLEPGVRYDPRPLPGALESVRRAADAAALGRFNPARVAERFYQLLYWKRVSRSRNFLDPWGHPTARGNRIIAERLYAELFEKEGAR